MGLFIPSTSRPHLATGRQPEETRLPFLTLKIESLLPTKKKNSPEHCLPFLKSLQWSREWKVSGDLEHTTTSVSRTTLKCLSTRFNFRSAKVSAGHHHKFALTE